MSLIRIIKSPANFSICSVFRYLLVISLLLSLTSCEKQTISTKTLNVFQKASSIIEKMDVPRGICAVVGDSLAELSIELAKQSELVVYLQLENDKNVLKAREAVEAVGFYGTRIYVEKGDLDRIHLANDLADAFIAVGGREVKKEEALRILRPEGKAFLGEQELSKPFPDGADDWSHPYHGPDNNTQSEDTVVKAPYLTQFFAEPYYAPVTQVTVASAGRVFKGFGNVEE